MLPDSEQGVFIDGDEFEPEGRHQEWLKIRERYEAQQEEERATSFDMRTIFTVELFSLGPVAKRDVYCTRDTVYW